MDVSYINKIANRSRLTTDANQLRDKVSQETAKIIKLRVAQDAAYWELKEKYQQLEAKHERLQQNMVEVQMEHETISGQYQDELRLRPETLNKVSSTRKICDILEGYTERLKETMSRCREDQAALCQAYHQSGQVVRDAKRRHAHAADRDRAAVAGLQEKVKLLSEHKAQMVLYFNTSKQEADALIAEMRDKLGAASGEREELVRRVHEFFKTTEVLRAQIQEKDATMSSLQNDMKQLIQECDARCANMNNNILTLENEIKESRAANEALNAALATRDALAEAARDRLQDALRRADAARADAAARAEALQDREATTQKLREEISELLAQKEELLNNIREQRQNLESKDAEIEHLKAEVTTLKDDITRLALELNTTKDVVESQGIAIEEVKIANRELEEKNMSLEEALSDLRINNEATVNELTKTIECKQNDLNTKADHISSLMTELKSSADAREKLESSVEKIKADVEGEREKGRERERRHTKQVDHLESVLKKKEEELSQQMTTILEIRSEKEILQEKISSMQLTIDNIQKELTPRPRSVGRQLSVQVPEQDDNAVMFPPTEQITSKKRLEQSKRPEFVAPQLSPLSKKQGLNIYNIFSDSSADADEIDLSEMNRRFEALRRGERIVGLPLTTLKRRPAPTSQPAEPPLHEDNKTPLSLSQVKQNLQSKEKIFFRNKRSEGRFKKVKKSD